MHKTYHQNTFTTRPEERHDNRIDVIQHNMPSREEDLIGGSMAGRQPASFRIAIADTSDLPRSCCDSLAGLCS